MIRINNINLPLNYDDSLIRKKVSKELRIEEKSIKSCTLFRRSIDARKKDNIFFLATIDAELYCDENRIIKKCKNAVETTP